MEWALPTNSVGIELLIKDEAFNMFHSFDYIDFDGKYYTVKTISFWLGQFTPFLILFK